MKVLIIPEDPTLDGYVVKPVVEALIADLPRKATVSVLWDPQLRGASQALDAEMVADIVRDNGMIDLFVLIVDRDCDRDGHDARANARVAEHPDRLVACVAVQEVEVWLLALHPLQSGASWGDIRRECDPKEAFAEPLLKSLGTQGPGRGRKAAMRALAGQLKVLKSRCPELDALQEKIRQWWELRQREP